MSAVDPSHETPPSPRGPLPLRPAESSPNREAIRTLADRVWDAARTAFKFIAGVALFLMNPGLFVAGFVACVLKPDSMRTGLDRAFEFWDRLGGWEKVGVAVASFAAFPQVAALASFAWGAYLVTVMGDEDTRQREAFRSTPAASMV